MTTRRDFLLAFSAAPLLDWPRTALAQSRQKPVVIGWLSVSSSASGAASLAAFKEGLAALGWKEGAQYRLEERWAQGDAERLSLLAQELVALKPAVIVGTTAQATSMLARASGEIPLVQASGTNPVETKLAASLARPGGMVTGLTNLATEVSEKLIELLSAIEPKPQRVGFLIHANPRKEAMASQLEAARRSASRHAITAQFAHPATAEDIERATAAFSAQGVRALVVMPSPYLGTERARILRIAQAKRWPVIATGTAWAEEGALLTYGVNNVANFRRAAYYVDRILKGAKPGDLPIEQPREFELGVNLKTAKALGITIPQSVLLQATRVIE